MRRSLTEEELANDEAYARFMERMPTRATATPEQIDAGQYIPDPQEVAQHSAFLDEMRGTGLNFEPSDPRWGGLEEDEAYDQLFAMHPAQREAFLRMMLGGKP